MTAIGYYYCCLGLLYCAYNMRIWILNDFLGVFVIYLSVKWMDRDGLCLIFIFILFFMLLIYYYNEFFFFFNIL